MSDPFPLVDFRSNEVLIAPFWDDSDNGQGGSVYYRLSSEPGLMDQIGANISGAFDVEFRPGSAFVATWNGLPQYLGPADVVSIPWLIDYDSGRLNVIFASFYNNCFIA